MSERDAMLAAILNQPDDDTARLVYADWLQENGQEPGARFIRAQIGGELCGLPLSWLAHAEPFLGCYAHQATVRLERGAAGAMGRDEREVIYTRGLISQVSCAIDDCIACGPAILATNPVARIYLPEFQIEIVPPAL